MDISTSDSLRHAGVAELLSGHWRFSADPSGANDGTRPINVPATSEALVFGTEGLRRFAAIADDDPRVPVLETIVSGTPPIEPRRVALILLCGGLGARSGGTVHPLLPVRHPLSGRTTTLLDLQLRRLRASPLAGAKLLILTSPFNRATVHKALAGTASGEQPTVYSGGLVHRFATHQPSVGAPVPYRSPTGTYSFNPAGHLDAIRWLVISGLLPDCSAIDVIIVASYSNWGTIDSADTLALANHALQIDHPQRLFVAEVAAQPITKRSGSLLAEQLAEPGQMRLIKYAYGSGAPRMPHAGRLLMSTNTLYFNVASLWLRLLQSGLSMQICDGRDELSWLIKEASLGRRRAEMAALFDHAFPVTPYLTTKCELEGTEVIQAERDLDQLSLLGSPSPMQPVRVPAGRSVSIKHLEGLENPEMQRHLFGTRDQP